MRTVHLVIVHSPCTDGYVSELCARLYYNLNPVAGDQEVVYWGTTPNKVACLADLEKKTAELKSDPNVVVKSIRFFDLAVDPVHVKFLIERLNCPDLQVYDHHLSFRQTWDEYAAKEPDDYKNNWESRLHYDVTHSGAYLAWSYYFPNVPAPLLVKYVEDRDLWRWALPDSKAINEALFVTSPPLAEHDKWLERYFNIDLDFTENLFNNVLLPVGKALVEAKERRIKTLYDSGEPITFDGTTVYSCNAPHLDASDLGNYAVNQKSEEGAWLYDIALIWRVAIDVNKCYVSVRSRDASIVELCKRYGGGGHAHAGGFELPVTQITRLLKGVPPP